VVAVEVGDDEPLDPFLLGERRDLLFIEHDRARLQSASTPRMVIIVLVALERGKGVEGNKEAASRARNEDLLLGDVGEIKSSRVGGQKEVFK
jgi:hypothetical protein